MLLKEAATPSLSSMRDEDLIQRYKYADDKDAFSILYYRYRHLVFGVCLKYLGEHNSSEDMTSFIFEKLLVEPPGTEVQSFKNWLYKVAVNECAGGFQKEKTRKSAVEKYSVQEQAEVDFVENDGLTQLMYVNEHSEEASYLRQGLRRLTEEQRSCVKLFYVHKKSYKAIAAKTGLDIKKVKSALQNGKRNLKNYILEKQEEAAAKKKT